MEQEAGIKGEPVSDQDLGRVELELVRRVKTETEDEPERVPWEPVAEVTLPAAQLELQSDEEGRSEMKCEVNEDVINTSSSNENTSRLRWFTNHTEPRRGAIKQETTAQLGLPQSSVDSVAGVASPSGRAAGRKRARSPSPFRELLYQASEVLRRIQERASEDSHTVFGRYIAAEMRQIRDDRIRGETKRAIVKIVLEAQQADARLGLHSLP